MSAKLLLLVFKNATLKPYVARRSADHNPDDDEYCTEPDSLIIEPTDVIGIDSARWIQEMVANCRQLKQLSADTLVRLPLADGSVENSADGRPLMFTTASDISLATSHVMDIHNDEDRLEQYLDKLQDSPVILYWT